jgi:hypothetical protein
MRDGGAMRVITCVMAMNVVALTGCASITGEKTQPLTIQTVLENKEVTGAGCTLANDAGKWFVTAPGSVMVHKSTGDMAVDCAKDPNIVGHETLVSKSNGTVWGNIVAGGLIGYAVDRNTGAGFDYPGTVIVTMRRTGEVSAVVPADAASAGGQPQASLPQLQASAPAIGASQATKQ